MIRLLEIEVVKPPFLFKSVNEVLPLNSFKHIRIQNFSLTLSYKFRESMQ